MDREDELQNKWYHKLVSIGFPKFGSRQVAAMLCSMGFEDQADIAKITPLDEPRAISIQLPESKFIARVGDIDFLGGAELTEV